MHEKRPCFISDCIRILFLIRPRQLPVNISSLRGISVTFLFSIFKERFPYFIRPFEVCSMTHRSFDGSNQCRIFKTGTQDALQLDAILFVIQWKYYKICIAAITLYLTAQLTTLGLGRSPWKSVWPHRFHRRAYFSQNRLETRERLLKNSIETRVSFDVFCMYLARMTTTWRKLHDHTSGFLSTYSTLLHVNVWKNLFMIVKEFSIHHYWPQS